MSKDKSVDYKYSTATGRRSLSVLQRVLFSLFSLAFVVGGLLSGYVFVVRLKAFLDPPSVLALSQTNSHGITSIIELVLGTPTPTVSPSAGASATADSAPAWGGKDRVNILLLGVDERPDEAGQATRTDTMMIVTIDPYSKSAGMLSIPRDLWLPIPFDDRNPIEDRINTAHFIGEYRQYPGGGPALAKKTVQYNFGIKIHYYARINFPGFRRLIDALGGIDVDVPATLHDDEYPTDDYGIMTIHIPKGRQHLNGTTALQYARSRHQDSDFGRMKRQQQVLLALRDRALQMDILPRLPQMAIEYRDIVKTDMSIADALALAAVAKEVDSAKITSRALEGNTVNPMRTAQGADILIPVRKEMEKLVAEVFFDGRLQEENARVEVLNGTGVPGMATQAAGILERRGFKRVSVGNVEDGKDYSGITIVSNSNKKYTVDRLAQIFQVPSHRIESGRSPTSTVDIRVILGKGARLP